MRGLMEAINLSRCDRAYRDRYAKHLVEANPPSADGGMWSREAFRRQEFYSRRAG